MDISLDNNGKIQDEDPLYDRLDKWHEDNEFDSVISAVLGIPRDQWSIKLHFRLISAYNNMKNFDSAADELAKIRPLCKSPGDLARFCYMNGYIHFMNDREMLALTFYKMGLEADPMNISGLDLKKECGECQEYIEEDLAELEFVSDVSADEVMDRCAENPGSFEADDMTFAVWLGYLFSIRRLPGITFSIGMDDAFKEFEGEEREAVKKCLEKNYGITGSVEMINFFDNDRYCNLALMVNDVVASLEGRPRFDIDILDSSGRQVFENTAEFVRVFAEHLPQAGVLAWDINEKIGFLRYAYSCGILSRDEYVSMMTALSDAAKENFSSSEEYIKSLVFGSAVCAFDSDRWNIKGAADHLEKITDILLNSALPDIKWHKPENSV